MSEATHHPARFLPRIRKELDKLPLTEEQKAKVTPKILENAQFVDTHDGRVPVGGWLMEDAPYFDFRQYISGVVERFAGVMLPDGKKLTVEKYLQAAAANPALFTTPPKEVARNITGVVKRFAAEGLTTTAYVQAALERPSLFTTPPETVARRIEVVVQRFARDGYNKNAKEYVRAALKHPSLFTMSPKEAKEVGDNISGVVERHARQGLTTEDYLKAAAANPALFTMPPEKVADNIRGMVQRFANDGMTAMAYVRAAVERPSLFATPPETVAGHITGVAERFADRGLTERTYVRAALKHPELFTRSPDTISRHIDIILGLYDDGVFTLPTPRKQDGWLKDHPHPHAPVIDFLMKNPALICLEDNNLALRQLHKEMTGADASPKNLHRSRRDTEHELMRHLGHDDPARPVADDGYIAGQSPPTEQQARSFVLRALAREGYIKGARLER